MPELMREAPCRIADVASASPQIKCMRILQQFPLADDPSLAGAVSAVLQRIIAVRASVMQPLRRDGTEKRSC